MRYSSAHAAKSGSVPFMLRGPKSVRTALTAAVAGVIGLVPTVLIASPAQAGLVAGVYAIADATGAEGGNVVFTITRAAPGTGNTQAAETITWTTGTPATATSGTDFTAVTTGEVTFDANSNPTLAQTKTISVTTLQDAINETDAEDFTVTLAGTGGITFSDATALGTIDDDDDEPTYTLNASPTTVYESTADGSRKATITATLSAVSAETITIPVATKEGTAKAGQDFSAVSGVITILPSATSGSITVDVLNDTVDEDDLQTFTVETTKGTNVAGTGSATVNIADDDLPPVLSIGVAGAATEGGNLTFNASLVGQSEKTVTATWSTANGATGTQLTGHNNAKAGDDYTATANGTVTFDPLATTPTTPILVKTAFDDLDEAIEDLSVKLTSPMNATLGTVSAITGSITDSGTAPGPQVVLAPTVITEGSATTSRARTFKVTLTKASGREQKIAYAVSKGLGTAEQDTDFTPTSAPVVLTFAAGELEKSFTVDVLGDNVDEGTGETFTIALSDVSVGGPYLAPGLSLTNNLVTITDDDDLPVLSLTKPDLSISETDGPAAALFEIKLSNPSEESVGWTAAAATNPGTAQDAGAGAGSDDYDPLSGLTGTILPGSLSSYVLFIVKGDDVFESDETARYTVTRTADDPDASGGPITAVLTIENDDKAPDLEIDSVTGKEGETVDLTGTVTGVAEEDTLVTVSLTGASVDGGKAASSSDFTNPGAKTVRIDAGTASGSEKAIMSVALKTDDFTEPAETILVNGSGLGGTGTVTDGAITIAANEGTVDPTDPTDPDVEAPTLESSAAERLGRGAITLSGTAAAGQTVDLWGKSVNMSTYVKLDSDTVPSNGMFSFVRGLNTYGMDFKAAIGDKESDPVKVLVREDPDITVTSTAKGTVRVTVTGDPRVAGLGAKVFQAKTGGGWITVGTGALNSAGMYTKTITGLTSGKSYTFRGYVVGNIERGVATNYSSYSRSVKVK